MYAIVEFLKENTVEIVPKLWMLSPTQCLWPPKQIVKDKLGKFIKKQKAPDETWDRYEINLLSEAKTFEDARRRLIKASNKDRHEAITTTDSEDYGRGKRQKFSTKVSSSESSDEEEDIQRFHKFKNMLPQATGLHVKSSVLEEESDVLRFTSAYDVPEVDESQSLLSPSTSVNKVNTRPELQSQTLQSQTLLSLQEQEKGEMSGAVLGQFGSVGQVLKRPEKCQALISPLHEHAASIMKKKVPKDGFLQIILRNQHLMAVEIMRLREEIENSVKTCRCNSKQSTSQTEQAVDLGHFPLSTEEELKKLEETLNTDAAKNSLVQKLKSYGGNNYGDHTRRILRFLFTDELAGMYNWMGAKKGKFSNLKVSSLIIDAVSERYEAATRSSVEDVIKTWLRHAKERLNYVKKDKILVVNNI